MGYDELILTLEQLPEDKQAEVLDFAKFLAQQVNKAESSPRTLAESPLAELMRNPLGVPGFKPLSREEANAR
jgi:hypothetical protein